MPSLIVTVSSPSNRVIVCTIEPFTHLLPTISWRACRKGADCGKSSGTSSNSSSHPSSSSAIPKPLSSIISVSVSTWPSTILWQDSSSRPYRCSALHFDGNKWIPDRSNWAADLPSCHAHSWADWLRFWHWNLPWIGATDSRTLREVKCLTMGMRGRSRSC